MLTQLISDFTVQDIVVLCASMVMFALGWMAGK